MINPKSIEIFLEIVEHRSISSVARTSYFSQPTISEHLNQLEDIVGTTLVLRGKGHRQIALTPAGEAFLPLAKKWMAHQIELENRVRQFSQAQPHNQLRLAASSGAHQLVVSNILYKLMALCPGVNIQLCNVERRELPAAIENFGFDIAFVFGDAPDSDLVNEIPLFGEEQYILCHSNSLLPNRVITPQDLDCRFEVAYSSYKKSKGFQDWHKACFPNNPCTTQDRFEVSSLGSVHNYITQPESWAVVPASIAMSNIAQKPDQLAFRRMEPQPPRRTCRLLIAKSYCEEKLVNHFLRCCDSFIEERAYLNKL